jgi:hypothetical protein
LGERSGSKINLISGSNTDLENLSPPLAGLSTSLVDTDSHLQWATEKIPRHPTQATAGAMAATPQSDTTSPRADGPMTGAATHARVPQPPPVVPPLAPPRARPLAEPPSAVDDPEVRTRRASVEDRLSHSKARRRLWRRESSAIGWTWPLVLSGLVVAAVLVAIFAFGR